MHYCKVEFGRLIFIAWNVALAIDKLWHDGPQKKKKRAKDAQLTF